MSKDTVSTAIFSFAIRSTALSSSNAPLLNMVDRYAMPFLSNASISSADMRSIMSRQINGSPPNHSMAQRCFPCHCLECVKVCPYERRATYLTTAFSTSLDIGAIFRRRSIGRWKQ